MWSKHWFALYLIAMLWQNYCSPSREDNQHQKVVLIAANLFFMSSQVTLADGPCDLDKSSYL